MRSSIIVDLDGTLFDDSKRRPFLANKEYDKYNGRIHTDTVNLGVKSLMLAMSQAGHKIIICTARPNAYRHATVQQLDDNDIYCWDQLHMRADDDVRSDCEVKQGMLTHYIGAQDVLFVIDDRKSVVDMWRKNGLLVFHCAEGDY